MRKPENTFQTVTATAKPCQNNYGPGKAAIPFIIPLQTGAGKPTGGQANIQFILLTF